MLKFFTWKYRRRRLPVVFRKSFPPTRSRIGAIIPFVLVTSILLTTVHAQVFTGAKSLNECLDDLVVGVSCYLAAGRHEVLEQRILDLSGLSPGGQKLFLRPEPTALNDGASPFIDGFKDITPQLNFVKCSESSFAAQCASGNDNVYVSPVSDAVVLQLYTNTTASRRENRWSRSMLVPARWPNGYYNGGNSVSYRGELGGTQFGGGKMPFISSFGGKSDRPIWSEFFQRDTAWSKMRHMQRVKPGTYNSGAFTPQGDALTKVYEEGSDAMGPTDSAVRDSWGQASGWWRDWNDAQARSYTNIPFRDNDATFGAASPSYPFPNPLDDLRTTKVLSKPSHMTSFRDFVTANPNFSPMNAIANIYWGRGLTEQVLYE